jgi:hypothetical protein
MRKNWEEALSVFLSCVGVQNHWMLVGSAASAVQGVAVEPGDVNLLVHPESSDDEMQSIAAALRPFATTGAVSQDPDFFLSTVEQPLVETPDASWLFGRWRIEGCKLEVARIRSDVPATVIIETLGTAVWDTRLVVPWRDHLVPVVPLEVELATTMLRGLHGRADAIQAQLAVTGLNHSLLAQAMADRGLSSEL